MAIASVLKLNRDKRAATPGALPTIDTSELDAKIASLVAQVDETRGCGVDADRRARNTREALERIEIEHLVGRASAEDAARARREAEDAGAEALTLRRELTERLAALERAEALRPQIRKSIEQRVAPELRRIYGGVLRDVALAARDLQGAVRRAMLVRDHIEAQNIRHFDQGPISVLGLPVPFGVFLDGPYTGKNVDRIDEFEREIAQAGL